MPIPPRLEAELAKDQLPETNPKGGGQAHPSNRSPRLTWSGDEPFQRGTSDQSTRALPPGDPSGSVFSSHVQERAVPPKRRRKLLLSSWIPNRSTPKWWSLSGSNRRPPACKAGALPAELRPLAPVQPSQTQWWARVDSNYRPHPYQGCALTN